VALVLALVGVLGLGLASAAQLSIRTSSIGAGTATVGSCQPPGQPVGVSFSNGFSSGAYTITGVTVSNVHTDCVGQTLRLRMAAADGSPVGTELSWPVAGGSHSWTLPAAAVVPASSVARAHVVIHG
jgi:hypothetical protein